jgi:hypothetical protein
MDIDHDRKLRGVRGALNVQEETVFGSVRVDSRFLDTSISDLRADGSILICLDY